MPRTFKNKPRKTLERLLDSSDERVALGAARALQQQLKEKADKTGLPAWYVRLEPSQQAVFRIVGAVEGRGWNIPLSPAETALAEELRNNQSGSLPGR
jgi:hypothetical protein